MTNLMMKPDEIFDKLIVFSTQFHAVFSLILPNTSISNLIYLEIGPFKFFGRFIF